MDQAIGMQRLNRRRRRNGPRFRHAQHPRPLQHQKSAQPLAALHGISHRVNNVHIRLARQSRIKPRLYQPGIARQNRRKAHIPSTGVTPTARPSADRISSTFSSASFNLSEQCAFSAAPRS